MKKEIPWPVVVTLPNGTEKTEIRAIITNDENIIRQSRNHMKQHQP